MGERATIDQDYLYDIADAIREKKGVTTRFMPAEMKPAILSIPTGGITPTGTVNITQNGTYDVAQYASANVNVQPNLQSKTATENGTVTPDSGYDGLSSVVVNVSGGGSDWHGAFYDWVNLNGQFFTLPVTLNADYKITVIFDVQSYVSNVAIIGTNAGANRSHLTMYNNKWYTASGTAETSFGALSDVLGKHTFITNFNNGNWLDGAKVTDYTPTTGNQALYINNRSGATKGSNWRLYEYKIESISTGETLYRYTPFAVYHNNAIVCGGLYESISNVYHMISGAIFGNDE